MMTKINKDNDVIIMGGGMVGLTLAIALSQLGLRVTIVDKKTISMRLEQQYDGRASAIAFATARMLDALGVWKDCDPYAGPIEDILITDGHSRGKTSNHYLHFDHQDIGNTPLGYMLENRHLRHVLIEHATQQNVQFMVNSAQDLEPQQGMVTMQDGQVFQAPIIIAADGRGSWVRRKSGIKIDSYSYAQHALVFTVHLANGHDKVAHEHFLEEGPLAVLPLPNNLANIVWTCKAQRAQDLEELGQDVIQEELMDILGSTFGDVTLKSAVWRYPLSVHLARKFGAGKVVLVGDAAHGIHPIAGQGLNLGLRDVATIAQLVQEQRQTGMLLSGQILCPKYERWRRQDCMILATVTHGINALFSNDIAPVRRARDVGLMAVGKLPPLKNFFMRHAGGDVGDLPPLMRGEKLRTMS